VIVVADASPLIDLAIIGQIDILDAVFDEIIIPRLFLKRLQKEINHLPKNSKYFAKLKLFQ